MKAVIQRTQNAKVEIDGKTVAEISKGLLVLVGIIEEDTTEDIAWLSHKIINLRIFSDQDGVMNDSLKTAGGEIIVVSQFTLHASTKKGLRPSYMKAAKPEHAIPIYEKFLEQMEADLGKPIQSGIFGADMKVSLLNDGPVTIIMDTKCKE